MNSNRQLTAEAVIKAALDAIVIIDQAGLITEWNPAASELFGYSRAYAIGSSLAELIIPDDYREAHRRGLEHYSETGEGPALDSRLTLEAVTSNHTRINIELTIAALETNEGMRFVGWLRDVTELQAARHAVEQSERRLSAMMDNTTDIITVIGNNGRWVSSSGAGLRKLGYAGGLSQPEGLLALLPAEDARTVRDISSGLASGTWRSGDRLDLRIRAADRTYRVHDTVIEDLTTEPAIQGIVLNSRDASSERARAGELRVVTERLSALVQSLSDGVLFVDEHGDVGVANQAFCDFLARGLTTEEIIGVSASQLRKLAIEFVADGHSFDAQISTLYENHRPLFGEEIRLTDGTVLERDFIPINVGHTPIGHLWLYRDITGRKRVEARKEELIDAERTARAQVEAQNQSLREVADMKSELVAMVSHELRTPLTSILSFTELLRSASDDESDASERAQHLSIIDRNAKRLQRLVDDLLLLSELESGLADLDFSRFRAGRLIDQIVEEFRPSADRRAMNLTTEVADGPVVYGDEGRLLQVVGNLLANAIKFSTEGSEVKMTAVRQGSCWTFRVMDRGPGIATSESRRVFDKFYRGPENARTVQGTGLGLAICKAIVELHGGVVRAAHRDGGGAVVEFSIPDEGVTL